MEKVFHFDSSPDHYIADAAVVCCFDERIRQVANKFLKRQQILHPDLVVVAGGAKTLASPRNDSERDFILDQIATSIRLHKATRVFLMNHADCGAYGGLKAFGGDPKREAEYHQQELQRAADLVRSRFPEIDVQCFFVTFDGVFSAASGSSGQNAGD